MKSQIILSAFIFIVVLNFSCRNNRLKTNEKALAKEILLQENQKKEADRIALEKQLADTLGNQPAGFLYKEDRSVDPAHPPVIIDFSQEIPVREIKLSYIASKVNYLVLQVPDDSIYFLWGASVNFTHNGIIINNNLGIHHFGKDGRFIETICKNTFDAPRKIDPDKPFSQFFPRETFRGAWQNHVKTVGNNLFYKYTDYPGEKVSLLKFSIGTTLWNLAVQQPAETGIKDTYAKGEAIATGRQNSGSSSPGLSSTGIIPVSENCYAGFTGSLDTLKHMLFTFNIEGDTLCKFRQYEYLKTPITNSTARSYHRSIWRFGQVTTFKSAFNDTIFRLIPPNRLLPVYVFKFGVHKVNAEEWLHVNIPLNNKIMITEILENQRFLFIQYSYYIPGNKLSKWEKALFDKSNNGLYNVLLDNEQKNKMFDYVANPGLWSAGLENDIDGGLPFWPSYTTPEGKLAISIRTEVLIRHIQKPYYKTDNKSDFANFTRTLKTGGREIVIMITE